MNNIERLFSKPLQSSRSGVLYNTFPYPTKISPESIAVYIGCMTKPGDTVLDAFAGSGSTGIATLLCEYPTVKMKELAAKLNVNPIWGARNASLYEIGTYASFASKTMLTRLSKSEYMQAVDDFIDKANKLVGSVYNVRDMDGNIGTIRYAIWSEILVCPSCGGEVSYFKYGTSRNPVTFKDNIVCPHCGKCHAVNSMAFSVEEYYDKLLHKKILRKKRTLEWIYGTTNGVKWNRCATIEDTDKFKAIEDVFEIEDNPKKIKWGELYRAGYHYGIEYLHQFYTYRNYMVMSRLWKLAGTYSDKVSDALKLLLLSYNATHCTLMTRVVAKKNAKDFVLTGAQSGVLYISKLPVEKNIIIGLMRKSKSFANAYGMLQNCIGQVKVHNVSSENMIESDGTVDFVFTDPPFGDFIPYAEVNQLNELWLNKITNRKDEVIISDSQKKDIFVYKEMLANNLTEISRVLKPNHYATIVFHAAKAKVWKVFSKSLDKARLQVKFTSILEKSQSSFKQVVSEDSVQGDPMVLVTKGENEVKKTNEDNDILAEVFKMNISNANFDKRRCYSIYISSCLERGAQINFDAREVYEYYDLHKGISIK